MSMSMSMSGRETMECTTHLTTHVWCYDEFLIERVIDDGFPAAWVDNQGARRRTICPRCGCIRTTSDADTSPTYVTGVVDPDDIVFQLVGYLPDGYDYYNRAVEIPVTVLWPSGCDPDDIDALIERIKNN